MIKYYIEDVQNKPRLIRQRPNKLIERYDHMSNSWVEDVEMLQIYTGDISVDAITEEDAIRATGHYR